MVKNVARRTPLNLPCEPPALVVPPLRLDYGLNIPGHPTGSWDDVTDYLMRHLYAPGGRQNLICAAGAFYMFDYSARQWVRTDDHTIKAAIFEGLRRFKQTAGRKQVAAFFFRFSFFVACPRPALPET